VLEGLRPADPQRIGPYRLLGRLGSGGMGQVFLGRSMGGRLVAVKVIHPELAGDREFRARFGQELAAARRVSGLFTAPVVDADLDGPAPWLTTGYVRGPSLGEAVAAGGPMAPGAVVALAAGLAEGLAGIHAVGVVHRDLKPSNVLLAEDGPRVIDFGISRAAEASALTGTGLVVGSPGFMSPEQADGREIGPATDVFSLGAVLVFAATGNGPFGSGSAPALLYRVVHSEPRLDDLGPELHALVARCLAKDPADRPGTAELLAELDAARPTETGPQDWLPAELFRPHADLALSPPPAPAEQAHAAERLAVDDPATRTSTALATPRVRSAPPPSPPPPGPAGLAGPASAPAPAPRRARRRAWRMPTAVALAVLAVAGALLAYHQHMAHGRGSRLLATLAGPSGRGIESVAFSPGGKTLAAASFGNSTYLWNVASGTRVATLTDPRSQGIDSVTYSPDGRTLAAADLNGSAYLWDVASRSLSATLTDPLSGDLHSCAFSSDGATLAASADFGDVTLWDVASRSRIARLTDPDYLASDNSVAFSPDGTTIAVGDSDGYVYLWSTASHARIAVLAAPATTSRGVDSIAFSPRGTTIVAGDLNGSAYLWDVASRSRIAAFTDPSSSGTTRSIDSVAFSPDGKTLATADLDGSVYLWNVASGARIATFTDPSSSGVAAVAFSPDGQTIAAGDNNGKVYLWAVTR